VLYADMTMESLTLQYCAGNLTIVYIFEMNDQICRHARKRKVKTDGNKEGDESCLCVAVMSILCQPIFVRYNVFNVSR